MTPGFELFDHTADLGIRAWGPTPADLLCAAADGLYAAIGEVVTTADETTVDLHLQATEADWLLRDFLAELLHRFEADDRRLTGLTLQRFAPTELSANLRLARIDQARSRLLREVKAVTYHALEVRRIPDGWEATIIVDI